MTRWLRRALDGWIVRNHLPGVDIGGMPVCVLCDAAWPCQPVLDAVERQDRESA